MHVFYMQVQPPAVQLATWLLCNALGSSLLNPMSSMELIGRDMKARGACLARMISYHGVRFEVEKVSLSKPTQRAYDIAVALNWLVLSLNAFCGYLYILY